MLAKQLQGAALATIPRYIEDVFSTYLYTGTAAAQTITNGIDLAGNGGLVWTKSRSGSGVGYYNALVSNATGLNAWVTTNATDAAGSLVAMGFNSNGYTINTTNSQWNASAVTYASWTFRKQAKFFDVVTYTGNGANRTISHNLGSTPGCIIVKQTNTTQNWRVWHRSMGGNQYVLVLNSTAGIASDTTAWNNTAPTATEFSLGTSIATNQNGGTYVAYLFAHDAGGFGASGTDNVISCGSYTGTGSQLAITLGYEPQFLIIKRTDTSGFGWFLFDNMRGIPTGSADSYLYANASDAEASASQVDVTATGFVANGTSGVGASGGTYIYIAIRRGPMRTPTSGTSVFYPLAISQADIIDSTGVPFPPDSINTFSTNGTSRSSFTQFMIVDRLRGAGTPNNTYNSTNSGVGLNTASTAAELGTTQTYVQLKADSQNITRGNGWNTASYGNWINYFFRRAPGFFDVVCYKGTGSNATQTHNLSVVPELIILKCRNNAVSWPVYHANVPGGYIGTLNASTPINSANNFQNTITGVSATTFSTGASAGAGGSTYTYVAYLFATLPGVSKVGSYTGNGSSQTINCGFAAGARFVLIKRTDSTGDWYVWDSARGIVSGNDPHLSLNSTAADVTTDDTIDPDNSGFIVNQVAATNVNVSSATYIFLAVS